MFPFPHPNPIFLPNGLTTFTDITAPSTPVFNALVYADSFPPAALFSAELGDDAPVPDGTSGVVGKIYYLYSWMKYFWMKTKGLLILDTWRLFQTTKILTHKEENMGRDCLRISTRMMGGGLRFGYTKGVFCNKKPR